MTEKFAVKHNNVKITGISDFVAVSGGIVNGYKNVCFARIVGENASLANDVAEMDNTLYARMLSGQSAYKRISSLPKLTSPDDISYYTAAYADWLSNGRNKLYAKYIPDSNELRIILSNACTECIKKLQTGRASLTGAIEKNFVVKLLFWLDYIIKDLLTEWDVKKPVKIVCENTVKKQEYIFFYFLTLVGFDVLLIQNKADLDDDAERLNLSAKQTIGNFGNTRLPDFEGEKYNTSQYTANSAQSGSVRINLSERPNSRRNSTAAVNTVAQSEPVRITLPERPNSRRNGTAAVNTVAQSEPVRITLPERPNSRRNGTAAVSTVAQREPVRITLPERPNSHRNTASPPPVQTGNTSGTFPAARQNPPTFAKPNINNSQRREKSYEELASLASSVVLIAIRNHKGDVIGTGSGIMIGRNGYILTNCHVAAAGKSYSVRIENDNKAYFTDELIKYNNDLDLAVIRIDRTLNPIPIFNGPQKLVRGQRVVAIGSPLGLFNSVSDGIIAGFRRLDKVDMIQFTAPISNGSSGGAVLNMYGEVIGISTAGIDSGQNINLAVGYESIIPFVRGFIQ